MLVETKDGCIDRVLDPRLREFDAAGARPARRRGPLRRSGVNSVTPDDVRGKAKTLRAAVARPGLADAGEDAGQGRGRCSTTGGADARHLPRGPPVAPGPAMFVTADARRAVRGRHQGRRPRRGADPAAGAATASSCAPEPTPTSSRRGPTTPAAPSSRCAAAPRSSAPTSRCPIPAISGDYVVQIPGGTPARCNPVQRAEGLPPRRRREPAVPHDASARTPPPAA